MSFRLGELAERVGGQVIGNPERLVGGLATLARAGADELSFLTNPRYRSQAAASSAGALLLGPGQEIAGRDLLVHADPYHALAQLLALFHPQAQPAPGVHPAAVVAQGAVIHSTAHVGALAIIGAGARLGERSVVHALAVIGAGCSLGADSTVHSHAVLYDRTEVGARCIIHSGAVLGSDGFGFATHRGRHVKVPQVGRVVVEDDVEIGSNTTVDRAMLDETLIGAGSKIDNLVQLGHNVRLGKDCLIVAQVGVSGSTVLGDHVVMAGQSGAAGHLELGEGSRVAAKSAVFKDVAAGEQVAGIPAIAAGRWRRQQALAGRLEEMQRRISELEKLIKREEKQ